MLTAGLISAVIANQLPGPGTIYLKQELNFLAPVHMGDTITVGSKLSKLMQRKPCPAKNNLQ